MTGPALKLFCWIRGARFPSIDRCCYNYGGSHVFKMTRAEYRAMTGHDSWYQVDYDSDRCYHCGAPKSEKNE